MGSSPRESCHGARGGIPRACKMLRASRTAPTVSMDTSAHVTPRRCSTPASMRSNQADPPIDALA